jgi:hypothetical protein
VWLVGRLVLTASPTERPDGGGGPRGRGGGGDVRARATPAGSYTRSDKFSSYMQIV